MNQKQCHCERSEAIQIPQGITGLPRRLRLLAMTVLGVSLLSFTACGFQPMYGTSARGGATAEAELAQVEIANIANREGQYLRNALIDRFYRDARPVNPAYSLHVKSIKETKIDLDITKSSDATRGQLKLEITMMLKNEAGESLLQRNLRTITSYNILGSEFATRVSEDNARTNALDDLARQIEQQLSLYFKRD